MAQTPPAPVASPAASVPPAPSSSASNSHSDDVDLANMSNSSTDPYTIHYIVLVIIIILASAFMYWVFLRRRRQQRRLNQQRFWAGLHGANPDLYIPPPATSISALGRCWPWAAGNRSTSRSRQNASPRRLWPRWPVPGSHGSASAWPRVDGSLDAPPPYIPSKNDVEMGKPPAYVYPNASSAASDLASPSATHNPLAANRLAQPLPASPPTLTAARLDRDLPSRPAQDARKE